MYSLTIDTCFIIVLCVNGDKNVVHEDKQALRQDQSIVFRGYEIRKKFNSIKHDMSYIQPSEFINIQKRIEEKLNFCLSMKEIFETTKKDLQTTDVITKRSILTTEEYVESKEMHTKRPTKTTGQYFDSTEKTVFITEGYVKVSTTMPVSTREEYFETTEKSVTDYLEITETPKETMSTIVDYPEDVTNYPILPTEIPIDTATITMKPWIHTTNSVQSEPWWITSIIKTRRTR
ncbi:uncharacterized protein [Choristoneura fumiferana]|uniref:uncharacterized protein n=1 Tax=Choristoneura fumiferana TaxID=7141 RepID=UPI003D15A300